MKKLQHLIGKIVKVSFTDHAASMGVVECVAYGELVTVTKNSIKLRHWDLPKADKETRDGNEEYISIVPSCISSVVVLVEGKRICLL